MNIEMIDDLPSMDGSEGLIAIVIRLDKDEHFASGLQFITPPTTDLQLATMRHEQGKVIEPHRHPPVKRTIFGTKEVLLVRSGVVMVNFFNSRGDFLLSKTLMGGDMVVLLAGGHGLQMLTVAEIIEVKQGPYIGVLDKIPFSLSKKSGTMECD